MSLKPHEKPAGSINRAAFFVVRAIVGALVRLFFRLRVEGQPTLAGGYVLAANHTSFLDPVVLSVASRRRVQFMMTEVVYRSAWLGWFYRFCRAIPVALRGGNRDALRCARATIERGEVLGIFPEGGISRDGSPLLGHPGAVSLGLAADVPIVPVAIIGLFEAFPPGVALPRPRRVTVVFGEPIVVSELGGSRRERLQIATETIMARIGELRASGYTRCAPN